MKFSLAILLASISLVFADRQMDLKIQNATHIYLGDVQQSLDDSILKIAQEEYENSGKKKPLQYYVEGLAGYKKAIYSSFEPFAKQIIHDAGYNANGHYFKLNKTTGEWTSPGNSALKVQDGASMNAKMLNSKLEKKLEVVINQVANSGLQKRWLGSIFRAGVRSVDNFAGAAGRTVANKADNAATAALRNTDEAARFRALDPPSRPPAQQPHGVPSARLDPPGRSPAPHSRPKVYVGSAVTFVRRALNTLGKYTVLALVGLGVVVTFQYMFESDERGIDTATQQSPENPEWQSDPGYDLSGDMYHGYAKDTQYGDIIDPETGYYWKFDPAAKAYYRWDDNTYERVYYKE